jgi:tRNA(fMet)-specific endonuclease VapC
VKYLPDTDHISILQRQSGAEYARLMTRIAQHPLSELAFSITSFHEQALGCHTYINNAPSSREVVRGCGMFARLLQDFMTAPVIPFDDDAATTFDRLLTQRTRVAKMDLRIAAIAMQRGMVLVTRNKRDFVKVPGLQIEDWTV